MSIASLRKFSEDLRRLPRVVAHQVAEAAAPAITAVARKSFLAGETPYGVPWAPGHEGEKVSLRKTDSLFRGVFYVAIGKLLRVKLGVKHAKYQIGKRPVFPRQDGALPPDYVRALRRAAVDVCRKELGR